MGEVTFEELFRAEYASMVALGAWLSGDVAAGEDLAQEAFGRALRRWGAVSRMDRPGAWVRRALINLASNRRRGRGREAAALARIDGDRPEEPLVDLDRFGPLWSAVAELPVQQRAAVALRYLDDADTATIAEALGCSEATVRVHLSRAHRRLADRLGCTTDDGEPDHGGTADGEVTP